MLRRKSDEDEPRRHRFTDVAGHSPALLVASVVVGLASGLAGVAYLLALHLLQHVLWPDHYNSLPDFLVLGGAGVVVVLIGMTLGRPPDVELLVDNIHVSGTAPAVRSLRSLVPMSLVTIASGGAAGPEAPLVTTCGTLGGWFARKRQADTDDSRSLIIAGMAAAFTVLFAAPIGSAIFALEILHRRGMEYYEALVPSLIGALTGYMCLIVLTHAGLSPIWQIPGVDELHRTDFLWAAGAGVVGAGIAVAFTYLTLAMRRIYDAVPTHVMPVIGGLGLALLAVWSPYALTFGEKQTATVLTTHLAVGVLVAALFAKLIATSLTVSSGWPGGFIIPLFFMGATMGQLANHMSADARVGIVCAALMAAANVGVTKTLLGSTLVVTEMGGIILLPTTLLAATIAFLLTSQTGLIESQRERTPRE